MLKDVSKNAKVLIVDDSKESIDLLQYFLKPAGFQILKAGDGPSALDMVEKELPDIILLDIMLPQLNGYEVCEKLKRDVRTKNIPVIFITAMTGDEDEAKGLALGAVDYITKPINPDLVRARVRNHLELKHLLNTDNSRQIMILYLNQKQHF